MKRNRIAVVGAGISGSLVARLLASRYEIQLFEAGDYIGGHTHTHDIELAGRHFAVDTGFMVFNERTYPEFCRMLNLLGVATQDSDMSFSVRCDQCDLQYQGSSLNGLFSQRKNIFSPRFHRMVLDVLRFNRQTRKLHPTNSSLSLGQFLANSSLGRDFIDHYLLPMTSAIWSCRSERVLEFPLGFLVAFLRNHGLLQIRHRPQWKTIVGGARNYLDRLLGPIHERIRVNTPVRSVMRHEGSVVLESRDGRQESFDQLVIATHADQAMKILADMDSKESKILASFPYQTNQAILHTDITLLPARRRAWASWNYHMTSTHKGQMSVTYNLSRLQKHDSLEPILLTLNGSDAVKPEKILDTFVYHHPAFNYDSIAAQHRHSELNGYRRTYYCGAYWGYGFHEDGVQSALRVANCFGIGLEACTAVSI